MLKLSGILLLVASLAPAVALPVTTTWDYDELGRLVAFDHGTRGDVSYVYDKNGSLTARRVDSTLPPARVVGVNATDGQFKDRVRVRWSAIPGATIYRVFRCTTASIGSCGSAISFTKSTSIDDTEGMANTSYRYRVKACVVNKCSDFSVADAGFRGSLAPEPPTGVDATDGAYAFRVRLTWNAVPGAKVYRVLRCTTAAVSSCAALVGTTNRTMLDDYEGDAGRVYAYRVKSCASGRCGEIGMAATGYRGVLMLAEPAGVSATDGAFAFRTRVTWQAVLGATAYRLFRCNSDAVAGCTSAVGSTGRASLDDYEGTAGVVYAYRVKACVPGKCFGFSAADTGYRGLVTPAAPTGVKATDGTFEDRVHVTWNPALGASVYQVFRCKGRAEISCGTPISTTAARSIDDSGGDADRMYYYRVKSCTSRRCSGFSVANAGHRGILPAEEADTIMEEVPIPAWDVWGRWMAILLMLGTGLSLLHGKNSGRARKSDNLVLTGRTVVGARATTGITARGFVTITRPACLVLLVVAAAVIGGPARANGLKVEAHRSSVIPSKPEFLRFSLFDLPVVDASGQVAFLASYFNEGQGGTATNAIWTREEGGALRFLVEDGMEAREVSATTFFDAHPRFNIDPANPAGRPGSVWINDHGEIAFSYYLEDTSRPGETISSAWIIGPDDDLRPLFYDGMPSPAGGMFNELSFESVNSGLAAIARIYLNENGQTAFMHHPDASFYNEFWLGSPQCDADSTLDQLDFTEVRNSDVAYHFTHDGAMLVYDSDERKILITDTDGTRTLVRTGEAFPGMEEDETLTFIAAVTLNNNGSVALLGYGSKNRFRYLYVVNRFGAKRLVKKYTASDNPFHVPIILLENDLLIYGTRKFVNDDKAGWSEVWLENRLIVKKGDELPGTDSGQTISQLWVTGANNRGQIVFKAKSDFPIEGVYAWDGANMVRVAQTGDMVEVAPGEQQEISTVTFNTSLANSKRVINDAGKLVFRAGLKESGGAIISARVEGTTTALNECGLDNKLTAANYAASAVALGLVNTHTGELVLGETVDLDLGGGPFPLYFSRYFASGLSLDIDNPLGNNWRHNFEVNLSRRKDSVQVLDFSGRVVRFARTGGDGTAWELKQPLDTPYQLHEGDDEFVFADLSSHNRYVFATKECRTWRLTAIKDRNDNTLALEYDANDMLSKVSDGMSRQLTFNYDADQRHLVRVNDGTRNVRFSFNAANVLTRSTDAENKATTYAYGRAACGLLTRINYPDGKRSGTIAYDKDGRVQKLTGVDGNTHQIEYDKNLTTVTMPENDLGKVYDVKYAHTAKGELGAYRDETGKRIRYTYDPRGRLLTVTDRLPTAGVTRYAYHGPSGRIASVTLPDTTSYQNIYRRNERDGIGFYDLVKTSYADNTNDTFTYDQFGNLVTWVDQANRRWLFTYNDRGQVLTTESPREGRPAGGVTTYTYNNTNGNLVSVRDDANNSTSMTYDNLKRLSKVQHEDGSDRVYRYNARDDIVSVKNEIGQVMRYGYDDNANLKTIRDPRLNTTTFELDALGRLNRVTDTAGSSTEISYDQQSRIRQISDRVGDRVVVGYDARGQLNRLTDPRGKTWKTSYDAEGVLASATDPAGKTTMLETDSLGRTTKVTDELGNTFKLTYDSLSRIKEFENQVGGRAKLEYGATGQVSRIELPGDVQIRYQRNARGQLTRLTDPNGNVWREEYDRQGRLVATYDPAGEKESYAYDNRNRLAQVSYPDNGFLDIKYDGMGNIIELLFEDAPVVSPSPAAMHEPRKSMGEDQQVKLSYFRDEQGRLVGDGQFLSLTWDKQFNRIVDSNGIKIAYLPDGNISTITYTDGKKVTYRYKDKVLVKVIDWDGEETIFTYRDDGRLAAIRRPNKTITEYRTFDDPSNANYKARQAKGEVPMLQSGMAVEVVDEFHIVDGDKLGISDTTHYAVLVGRDKRIQQVVAGGFQNTRYDRGLEESLDIEYTNGRQIKGLALNAFEYEGGKLLYDNQRRFTWKAKRISSIAHYVGLDNVPGHYTAWESASYDALGHRIYRKAFKFNESLGSNTTDYLWNYALGRPVVAEVNFNRIPDNIKWKFVYLPGGQLLFAVRNSDNKKFYYHFDLNGNTTFLSDQNSDAVEAYDYTSDGTHVFTRSLEDDIHYRNPFTYRGFYGWMSDVGDQVNDSLQPKLYSTGTGFFNSEYHRYIEYTNWHNYDLAAAPEIHYMEEPLMAGAIMAATGFLMIVIPEPTSSVGGAIMVLSAIDMMFTGAHTIVSGEEKTTLATKMIRVIPDELGVDPATTDKAMVVGGLVLAGAGGAGISSSAMRGIPLVRTRNTKFPNAPQESLVGRIGTAVGDVHPETIAALRAKYANLIWALEKGGMVEAPSFSVNTPGSLQNTYGVGLRQLMADVTAATGREVGLFRTNGRGGARLLVLGEPGSVKPPPGTWRMIAHTHPNGTMWFSGENADMGFLRHMFDVVRRPGVKGDLSNHGYRSVLITPGGEAVIPRFGVIWEINGYMGR